MNHLAKLLVALRAGPLGAAELRAKLKVSPATLGRLAAQADGMVLRYGKARASAYASMCEIPGVNRRRFPVTRVDGHGATHDFGEIVPVRGGFLHLEAGGDGVFYDGLPWWMADMTPQGFTGRAFAMRHAAGGPGFPPLPANPADWSDDLRLAVTGSSLWQPPGDLVVGETAPDETPVVSGFARELPELARRALAGDVPGSSAGGEQPKFFIRHDDGGGPREYLVKFSWGEGEATRRRRADLLVCESLATRDEPETMSRIVATGDAVFLLSPRWDRTPRGRRGVVSLGALDDAFTGARRSWTHSAAALAAAGVIAPGDALAVRRRECFARLIGNNDRHGGNIAFFRTGLAVTGLAPTYDMLPMTYAPGRNGDLPDASLAAPAAGSDPDDLREALPAARRFWEAAAAHPEISENFRKIAAANAGVVAGIRPGDEERT